MPRKADPETADYPALTTHRSSVANFNEEVFRGVAQSPNTQDVYALNSAASTLIHIYGQGLQSADIWPTLHQPVALALFNEDVLVLGGASQALLLHSGADGRIIDAISLGSEPADLVVDQDLDRAYVSCQGDDTIREINLLTFRERRRFQLQVKRPGFLHFEPGEGQGASAKLYVTPMLSGNNSMSLATNQGTQILQGYDNPLFPSEGLPDIDLLCIDLTEGLQDPIQVRARGAASVLLGHGIHPTTGEHWLLGIDEINADPTLSTEPALKGRFARNVLAKLAPQHGALVTSQQALTGASLLPSIPKPTDIIDLDDSDPNLPGGQYDSNRTPPLAFPYGLAFTDGGLALVSAPGSDRIALLDESGQRIFEFELPSGSIPRQALVSPNQQGFFAYCQGTSQLTAFSLIPLSATPIFSLDLGSDPTPEFLQRGRQLWYSSVHSANQRLSCNTCHVAGGSDGLAWGLSNPPQDYKGVLMTQSLLGIDDTFPYHWRGERDFAAFNSAFVGLMGATASLDETPGADFDAFEAFVFSLEQAANPKQSLERRLSDGVDIHQAPNGLNGSAVSGLAEYLDLSDTDGNSCADCHAAPTGSLGDFRPEAILATEVPFETTSEIANYEQLALRDQVVVQVPSLNGSIERPLLGFGVGSNGGFDSLFQFLERFHILTQQHLADLLALLRQWDFGTAPAAHVAWLLNADSSKALPLRIREVLLEQAHADWIDVAAFGQLEDSSVNLFYNATSALFESDDARVGTRQAEELFDLAANGQANLLFVGLPPGNGWRFAFDRDFDGLAQAAEISLGSNPYQADTDGDGDKDGHEVDNSGDPLDPLVQATDNTPPSVLAAPQLSFSNARSAKLFFRTDEPVQAVATVQTGSSSSITETLWHFDREHTLVLRGLDPSPSEASGLGISNTYSGTLTITDRAGNSSSVPINNFASAKGSPPNPNLPETRIGSIRLQSLQSTSPTELEVSVTVNVVLEDFTPLTIPANEQVVVAQVLVRAPSGALQISPTVSSSLADSFELKGIDYTALPGPFLVSAPTDASGQTLLTFTETGLTQGQELTVNIVTVLQVTDDNYDSLAPNFDQARPMNQYQMPATPPALRQLRIFAP